MALSFLPVAFFIGLTVFRILDTTNKLYDKLYPSENFIWGVPLKRLKKDLKFIKEEEVKKVIRKNILYRRLHYFFLIIFFLSIISIGVISTRFK